MPVEQVVKSVCNYKQAYTQYGGLRPFGTAFLFAGWDSNFGFQLYQTDPSGNYSGWKATVIGESFYNYALELLCVMIRIIMKLFVWLGWNANVSLFCFLCLQARTTKQERAF